VTVRVNGDDCPCVQRRALGYRRQAVEVLANTPGVAVSDAELKQWKLDRISKAGAQIAAIKAEPGPDVIVWGGSRLAGALAAADLIDEYRLLIQPLVLGRGQALFDQLPASRHLDLVQATPFPSGIVVHVYRPQHT
jgi:dihydrofolate reductase